MKIRRITVENFRSLGGPLTVELPERGLCVIAGDNEEGKSTIVDAVRTVLFERHRITGQAAQALLPFGSKVQPRITVDFAIDGKPYSIFKAFVQRPRAKLVTPTGTYEGDDAERELQALFRTRLPSRGASKPEHRGVWGLLWVEQGKGFDPVRAVGTARRVLQSTLQDEIGEVLASETGTALLETVRERLARYYDKRGLSRGELKEAQKRVVAQERKLEELDVALQTFAVEVDQLSQAIARQASLRESNALDEAERALAAAEAKQSEVAMLKAAAAEASQRLEIAVANLRNQRNLHAQRAELREAVDERAKVLQHKAVSVRELAAALREARGIVAKHQKAVDAEDEAIAATAERLDEARMRREIAENATKLRRLKKRLRISRRHRKAMAEVLDRAAAIPIDETGLREIEDAQGAVLAAKARLDAASASVTFDITSHEVQLNGRPAKRGEPIHVVEPTRIEIEGVGGIDLVPGGNDLEKRVQRHGAAQAHLTGKLAGSGFEDVATARAAWDAKRALQGEGWDWERRLVFEAPEGIDTLERTVDELKTTLAEQIEAADLGEAPAETEVELEVRQLRAALERRTEAREAAASLLESAKAKAKDHESRHVEARAAAHAHEEETDALTKRLAAARTEVSDSELKRQYLDATAAHELRENGLAAARETLSAADPEKRAETLREATGARQRIARESQRLDQSVHDSRLRLAASGRSGLGEQREDTANELEHSRARLAEFTRDAAATKLLVRVLEEAERDAKAEFLTPIASRLTPLLNRLIPNAELNVDADLKVHGLVRARGEEPFESLSVGTREQIAVLTRLAFADILRSNGQEAPLFLDDALVYSDDTRFARMKAILKEAAASQQIIVMTCRRRDWEDMGVPITTLGPHEPEGSEPRRQAPAPAAQASRERFREANESDGTRATSSTERRRQ